MVYYRYGSVDTEFNSDDLKEALFEAFSKLGFRKKVLAIPPDFTRFHSFAGELTNLSHQYFGERLLSLIHI